MFSTTIAIIDNKMYKPKNTQNEVQGYSFTVVINLSIA